MIVAILLVSKVPTLALKKISISEEYTKLPLRYNEAGLIKYLEKNGIGRPSTFSSIISKGIENNSDYKNIIETQ